MLSAGAGVVSHATVILIALLPGLVLLGMAIASRGKVGIGDALVLFALAAWGEAEAPAWTLLFALLLVPVAAVIFKKKKHAEIPFVPFLLAGYLMYLAWI